MQLLLQAIEFRDKINRSISDLMRKMNVALINAASFEVESSEPESVSLGKLFGRLDAVGYFILFLSLVVTVVVGYFVAVFGLMISIRLLSFSFLFLIPAVGAGFLSCLAPSHKALVKPMNIHTLQTKLSRTR